MLNSVALYNLSQNTAASVSIQTGLKAIGRPCAVVLDNGIDSNTKKIRCNKRIVIPTSLFRVILCYYSGFQQRRL